MDIKEYIGMVRALGSHRRSGRTGKATDLCKEIRGIAEREGVSVVHINNVYKQMVDSGIVNKDELLKFQMDITAQWGRTVGLDSPVSIINADDIEIEEF